MEAVKYIDLSDLPQPTKFAASLQARRSYLFAALSGKASRVVLPFSWKWKSISLCVWAEIVRI